jgi:hypothetical protein
MKATVHLKRNVAELYHQVTGKVPQAWCINTRSYVSVKLLDRHLSDAEHACFVNKLREAYGKDFLLAKNTLTRSVAERNLGQRQKVVVRFACDELPETAKAPKRSLRNVADAF